MLTSLNRHKLTECRRLFLRNFEVPVKIGVDEIEKKGAQRMLVNVDVYIPLEWSTPKRDDVSEVVDYNFMRDALVMRTMDGHIQLQETLCDDVARILLSHPKVVAVRVSTEKPDIYADCESVGVEVFHIKEEM
ncbi:MAG: dihydroneopterin aldolase [Burkholderiaceae bacterium]|nr:dihydroneopterin aldolase [Burkholderiaceae bacterium]